MIFSRIKLNPSKRETLKLLSSPLYVHGALERSFPGKRDRKLWRIDQLHGEWYLLVLSKDAGDFRQLCATYGFSESDSVVSKDYSRILEQPENGTRYHFRLKANPITNAKKEGERGRIHAHVTRDQQKKWLVDRSNKLGFSLKSEDFEVVNSEWVRFRKKSGHQVTYKVAIFEGILTVDDVEGFRKTLINGVGRQKAYGCGFLTIAKG